MRAQLDKRFFFGYILMQAILFIGFWLIYEKMYMQVEFSRQQLGDAEHAVRRCGYGRMVNRDGEVSYVRRLDHGMLYPRFHVYLKDYGDIVQMNLHLDQKAPVYEGVTAHSGEYDGDVVEREAERITSIIAGSGPVAPMQFG